MLNDQKKKKKKKIRGAEPKHWQVTTGENVHLEGYVYSVW